MGLSCGGGAADRQGALDDRLIDDSAEPAADASGGERGSSEGDAAVDSPGGNEVPTASELPEGNMRDAGSSDAGTQGIVPLGGLCATNDHCKQDTGSAVCCGNTCTLEAECVSNPGYLPCSAKADCGGKVCCELKSGEDTMRFCTKPSACRGGAELP